MPVCLSSRFYPESDSSQSQGMYNPYVITPPGTPHQDTQSVQTATVECFPAFAIFPLAGIGFDNQ
jgi:hypothetical protein